MSCARFEDWLFEELDGRLPAAARSALERHLRECDRCSELRAILAEPVLADEDVGVPGDLVAAVLERTSVATTRALERARRELPELAELDPGEAFVGEVLAATVGTRRAVRTSWRARLERAWAQLAQRPRLALEGAYAGVLVLVLVLGLPSPSLAELPVRAFNGIRQEAAQVERVVSSRIGGMVELGREAWSESYADLGELLAAPAAEGPDKVAADLVGRWYSAARDLFSGIWEQLFAPLTRHLRALWTTAPDDSTSHLSMPEIPNTRS